MKSRITLLLIATVLTLSFSCKNANQPTSFGGPVDEKVAVPASEAKNLLTDKPEATATLAGKVNEVCQAEGCWFNLDQGSGVALLVRFLIEAVTVTAIGGAIGVVTGYGLAFLLSFAMGFPVLISIQSAVLGVTVSFVVGLISGLYPAWRASQLNPIDAMRNE